MNFDDAMHQFRAYLVDDVSTDVALEQNRNRLEGISPPSRRRNRRRATVLAGCALVVTAAIVSVVAIRSTRPTRDVVAAARVDWGLDAEAQVFPETGVPLRQATDRAISDIRSRARNADIRGFQLTADDDGLIRMRFPGGEGRYQVEYFLHVVGVPFVDSWGPINRPGSGYSLVLATTAEYGARPRQTGEPYSPTPQTAKMMSGPPDQRRTLAPIVRALRADTEVGPLDLIVEQRALGAVAIVREDGALLEGTIECPKGLGAPPISTCGSGGGGPYTGPDGTIHSTVFITFAPIAPEIARVELQTTDGRTFPGAVGNGWYLIVVADRRPVRDLSRSTVVGYDSAGKKIASASLSAGP